MTAATGTADQLAPVRARMLRDATDQAAQIVADAHRTGGAIVARAQQDAAAVLAQARAAGQRDGAMLADAERSRGRREARTLVLRAQRAALDELRAQVRTEVAALRGDPGYGQLHDQLAAVARLAAGPGATVADSPDGGVLARAAGVTVDCSLTRLAELAVQALGPQVRELWTR
jgi:vacuolar-type H+-ATPase subunit E/Vma4